MKTELLFIELGTNEHLMVSDYHRVWAPTTPQALQVRCRKKYNYFKINNLQSKPIINCLQNNYDPRRGPADISSYFPIRMSHQDSPIALG